MKNVPEKKLLQRLKIIEGQIRGLQKMVLDKKYCIDIITQTFAVKKALSSVEDAILKDHLSGCLIDQVKKGKEKKAMAEILEIYKVAKKK